MDRQVIAERAVSEDLLGAAVVRDTSKRVAFGVSSDEKNVRRTRDEARDPRVVACVRGADLDVIAP